MVGRARILPLLVAFVLAACGGPRIAVGPLVTGTAVEPGGGAVLGVGLLLFDPAVAPTAAATGAAPVAPADVLELGPGSYATSTVPVAADGGFRLHLPLADDLPDGVLVAAADFLGDTFGLADCAVTASADAARVSAHRFDEGRSVPGLYAVTADGLTLTVVTESPVDATDLAGFDGRFLTWLYADQPVALQSVGTGCIDRLDVGLTLATGWNAVGWTRDAATGELRLRRASSLGDLIVTAVGRP
jgi:hypothetical protein